MRAALASEPRSPGEDTASPSICVTAHPRQQGLEMEGGAMGDPSLQTGLEATGK